MINKESIRLARELMKEFKPTYPIVIGVPSGNGEYEVVSLDSESMFKGNSGWKSMSGGGGGDERNV